MVQMRFILLTLLTLTTGMAHAEVEAKSVQYWNATIRSTGSIGQQCKDFKPEEPTAYSWRGACEQSKSDPNLKYFYLYSSSKERCFYSSGNYPIVDFTGECVGGYGPTLQSMKSGNLSEEIRWDDVAATSGVDQSISVLRDRCFEYLAVFCPTSAPYFHASNGHLCTTPEVTSTQCRTLSNGKEYCTLACEASCCGQR